MTRLAANLRMLFTELPFAERFAAARDAGFSGVEFSFNDELAAKGTATMLRQCGLAHVLGTLPDSKADVGLAAAVGGEREFAARFERGFDAAVRTECPIEHITTGVVHDAGMLAASRTFLSNINWALREAERQSLTLTIEAVNQRDLPGYFIRSISDAVAWIERIGNPRLRLLVDLYHAHAEGLDPGAALAVLATYGGHAQIAGAPSRAEPDTGVLNYVHVFHRLDAQQYAGWVGCEYRPASSTTAGLSWLQALVPQHIGTPNGDRPVSSRWDRGRRQH